MPKSNHLQPIFIIGAGRSGTKIFRDILLASGETCAIPYDINYIWRYGNEHYPHDELPISSLDNKKITYIRNTITKMASPRSNTRKYLLEKTVSNGLRIRYIQAVFPEAKFIHLIRDGRAVTESSMRTWKSTPDAGYLIKKLRYFPWSNYRYAIDYFTNLVRGKFLSNRGQEIWGPRYNGIEEDSRTLPLLEICARQWNECVVKASESLTKLPDNKVLTIYYEDFVNSVDTVKLVTKFVGITDSDKVIAKYNVNIRTNNLEKWKSILTQYEKNFLNKELASTLQMHKYI